MKLYNEPIADGEENCPYIKELLELQATHHSKYITTVEAPNIEGKHDDMSDALIRMVWLASQKLGKPKYMTALKKSDGQPMVRRRGRQRVTRGGSSPDRQLPPKKKRW